MGSAAWLRHNRFIHEIWNKSHTGNMCMERFIVVKEMMHLFDDDDEKCDTGEAFDDLVQLFLQTTTETTQPFESEIKCFWRALGLLCPQSYIPEFQKEIDERGDSDLDTVYYDIALRLKIPQQYVPHLFTERYQKNIKFLCSNDK